MGRGRNRLKSGWVSLEKRRSPHRWVAHWYLNTTYESNGVIRYRQASHVLGFRTKEDLPTRSAALAKWTRIREGITASPAEVVPDVEVSFAGFVTSQFVPVRESGWRPRSRERFDYLFSKMNAAFGTERLADLDRSRLQQFLDRLALDYCHDTVHLAHTYLRAIFRLAVDEGRLQKNPARALTVPKTTRDRDETILSLECVQRFEDELNGADRTIWQLLSRCGLRAGEVFGLQWPDLTQDHALHIRRIYARGRVSEPKTKKSKAAVAVPAAVYRELLDQRQSTEGDDTESMWMFPSTRKRWGRLMPIDYHNWLNRVLKPLGERLGIRANHQILRRTFASLAYNTGGDLKDIQAQMRHANVNTTANIYTKPIPTSVRAAVEALDRRIRKRARPAKS